MITGKIAHLNIRAGLNKLFKGHRLLVAFFCLLVLISYSQARNKKPKEKVTRIDLIHADVAQANQMMTPDAQILIGNVKFKHNGMFVDCDSAVVYSKTNSFQAYNNIKMKQGDTLFIYGDYLNYDGITQLAMLRDNVRL